MLERRRIPTRTRRAMSASTAAPVYLMSPPRPDWALKGKANFKSRQAEAVDAARAIEEWERLANAIVEAGGEVVVMPPGEASMTGLIYTAEAGELGFDRQGDPFFLLPHMAVEHRRGEAGHIQAFVEGELGIETRAVNAVWEAQGDAIRARHGDMIIHTYGEGPDRRTSEEAYDEVAGLLSPQHIQVGFRADPWFHGNTFLQFFRGQSGEVAMLVCPEALLEGDYERLKAFVGDVEVVELSVEQSEGYDTNALQVDETVLAPQSFSDRARGGAEGLGLEVVELNLSELFSKGGGAPVCLTNRLWGLEAAEIPPALRWSKRQD